MEPCVLGFHGIFCGDRVFTGILDDRFDQLTRLWTVSLAAYDRLRTVKAELFPDNRPHNPSWQC